jgi:hypothetical protein
LFKLCQIAYPFFYCSLKIKKADKTGRKEAANEIKRVVKEFEEQQKQELRAFDDAQKLKLQEEDESMELKQKIVAFKFNLPTPDQNPHPEAFPIKLR